MTSGPLVLLQVNGREPGDEIRLPAGKHTVKVDVEVKSITPVESIGVMHNGQALGDIKTVTLDRSGWISVQVKAKYTRDPIRRPYPFAATMPVWITVDGKPVRSKADAEYFVPWIDRTLERVLQLSFNSITKWNETRLENCTRKPAPRWRSAPRRRGHDSTPAVVVPAATAPAA